MDLFNDKPPKATMKHKLFKGQDVFKADMVTTTEKQNVALSNINVRPTSKCKSFPIGVQSAERKRPNTTSLKSSSAPSSFHFESFVGVIKKDKSVRNASLDNTLKNTTREDCRLIQGAHSRVVDQHRWPAMKGGKLSTMEFSSSMNMIDRIEKATSLMLQSRGLSPSRRIPLDGINKSIHKSPNRIVNVTSPHAEEENILPRLSPPFVSPNDVMDQIGSSSLLLSQILDMRKGIKSADLENIHQLRLLCNRELQWRFVNSKAKVAFANQRIVGETICNNAWNVNSELQDFVTMEKINVERLKQGMKLDTLLKEQEPYFEDWFALEGDYFTSLHRTIEALKSSMLRLPVASGAKVDVRAVKNAISSTIDIMQAMSSSVYSLLLKVEDTKRLLCHLSAVVVKEKAMLDECRLLSAALGGMQVEECSLRAQILQQLRQDIHML